MTDWFPPDKPPTVPIGVIVTLQLPDKQHRVTHEAFYMGGKWIFAAGELESEIYAGWPLLAWAYKPDPFEGGWT